MKQTILALALALAFGGAYASQTNNGCQGNCPTTGGGTTTVNTDVKNTNTNVNSNKQEQGQAQGQMQGQGQVQGQVAVGKGGAGGSATNAGNSQQTTISLSNEDRLQAPGVAVAATTTTASCMVGYGGGVSFPGGAIALSGATKDKQCDKRALGLALIDAARIAHSIGGSREYVAMVYTKGMELLIESGQEEAAAEKTAVKTSGDTTGYNN